MYPVADYYATTRLEEVREVKVVAIVRDRYCEQVVCGALAALGITPRVVKWSSDDPSHITSEGEVWDCCVNADLVVIQNPPCGSAGTLEVSSSLTRQGGAVRLIGSTQFHNRAAQEKGRWTYRYPSREEIVAIAAHRP